MKVTRTYSPVNIELETRFELQELMVVLEHYKLVAPKSVRIEFVADLVQSLHRELNEGGN